MGESEEIDRRTNHLTDTTAILGLFAEQLRKNEAAIAKLEKLKKKIDLRIQEYRTEIRVLNKLAREITKR